MNDQEMRQQLPLSFFLSFSFLLYLSLNQPLAFTARVVPGEVEVRVLRDVHRRGLVGGGGDGGGQLVGGLGELVGDSDEEVAGVALNGMEGMVKVEVSLSGCLSASGTGGGTIRTSSPV